MYDNNNFSQLTTLGKNTYDLFSFTLRKTS